MKIRKLDDGRYQVDDRSFGDAGEAMEYAALRSRGETDLVGGNAPPAGTPVQTQPRAPSTSTGPSLWWLALIIPVALLLMMVVLGALVGKPDEQSNARSAIQMCWKEQQRKSLEPGLQRFVAGACERMENEFRAQYRAEP